MFDYAIEQIYSIERSISTTCSRNEVYEKLRLLGLSDFGELLISIPDYSKFPTLSSILPKMTPILDYGCGYGRILRMMYYFTDEDNVYGVDPWKTSIDFCTNSKITKNIYVSENIPSKLPVGNVKFDLIFSFSVFTHLSKLTTIACLNTIWNYLKPDGLIVITVRPSEYWELKYKDAVDHHTATHLKKSHKESGFAFVPHNIPPIDGEITYGDTSMTVKWICDNVANLKIAGTDRSLSDPYQLYIFLQKT